MTLQQLRYVVAVSHYGSINAAAQNLFIAQSSISKSIKDLEEEVGVTIFERGHGGVAFTADGMELLGYANAILEQASNLQERFRGQGEEKAPRFSISAQHYVFVVDALIDFINNRLEDFPQYNITIREGRTAQVIDDVLTQQSQLGVLFLSNTTERFLHRLFLKNGITFTPLVEFSPHVYLRKGHPLAQESDLSMEQLAPYPFVRYEQGADSFNYSEEIFVPEEMGKRVYVTDRSALLSIIRNTNAYSTGSGCLLPSVIHTDIVSIPLRGRVDRMQVGWIQLNSMVIPPEMVEYIQGMEQSIQRCVWGSQNL